MSRDTYVPLVSFGAGPRKRREYSTRPRTHACPWSMSGDHRVCIVGEDVAEREALSACEGVEDSAHERLVPCSSALHASATSGGCGLRHARVVHPRTDAARAAAGPRRGRRWRPPPPSLPLGMGCRNWHHSHRKRLAVVWSSSCAIPA